MDGQHRTLGTFLALDEVNAVISQARDGIEAAENNGDAQMQAHETKRLDRAVEQRERLNREHVSVDLAIVSTKQGAQMFVDIADNAKGVNPDFTSVLDRRDVVNRIAADLSRIASPPRGTGRVSAGRIPMISAAVVIRLAASEQSRIRNSSRPRPQERNMKSFSKVFAALASAARSRPWRSPARRLLRFRLPLLPRPGARRLRTSRRSLMTRGRWKSPIRTSCGFRRWICW